MWGTATWWDGTVAMHGVDEGRMLKWLDDHGERWVVARETGQGGYRHYQIRVAFKSIVDEQSLTLQCGGHWTPSATKNFEYIYKGGDFITSWNSVLAKYLEVSLRDWQGEAYRKYSEQDERTVLCVVDKNGRTGKSFLAKHIVAKHEGRRIPAQESAKALMQIAMAEVSPGYVIDVPRAEGLKREFWAGIEQIKDGQLYETRYAWAERWIEPPKVMVLSNKSPPLKELSSDRWDILDITGRGDE